MSTRSLHDLHTPACSRPPRARRSFSPMHKNRLEPAAEVGDRSEQSKSGSGRKHDLRDCGWCVSWRGAQTPPCLLPRGGAARGSGRIRRPAPARLLKGRRPDSGRAPPTPTDHRRLRAASSFFTSANCDSGWKSAGARATKLSASSNASLKVAFWEGVWRMKTPRWPSLKRGAALVQGAQSAVGKYTTMDARPWPHSISWTRSAGAHKGALPSRLRFSTGLMFTTSASTTSSAPCSRSRKWICGKWATAAATLFSSRMSTCSISRTAIPLPWTQLFVKNTAFWPGLRVSGALAATAIILPRRSSSTGSTRRPTVETHHH